MPLAAALVNGSHAFETAAECNRAETGHVEFDLDVYMELLAVQSAMGLMRFLIQRMTTPDRGARGTVYESMPILCRARLALRKGLG